MEGRRYFSTRELANILRALWKAHCSNGHASPIYLDALQAVGTAFGLVPMYPPERDAGPEWVSVPDEVYADG